MSRKNHSQNVAQTVSKQKGFTHQPRQRQTISKASHRRLKVARLEILIDRLTGHRRIHIRPYQGYRAPRDTTTLVANFDRNILFAFDDDNFDRWEFRLVGRTVQFDDSAQGVFQ
jgi:hypothetical protein